MKSNTLILTIGLPLSGKSTWATKQGHPVVNPDSIRLAIHGQPFIPQAEGLVWSIAKIMVRALFFCGHDTVILDATNLTEERRSEWRSSKWDLSYEIFHADEETCLARATLQNRMDMVPVIKRMAAQMEPLTEGEVKI